MPHGAQVIELQGHRGARGVLPENSIPGFRQAVSDGADCLELDIAKTRDGKIVITHDPALNPDITRRGAAWITERLPIKSLTYDELQSYDIGRIRPGTDYAKRFPAQQPMDGLRIPLLTHLFELPELARHPHVSLDIEIKTSPVADELTFSPATIADRLIELIDGAGLRARCRIRSFDWRSLIHVKQVAPDIPLAFLTAAQPWLDNLQFGTMERSPWLGGIHIGEFDNSAPKAIAHLGGAIWAPYPKTSPSPNSASLTTSASASSFGR